MTSNLKGQANRSAKLEQKFKSKEKFLSQCMYAHLKPTLQSNTVVIDNFVKLQMQEPCRILNMAQRHRYYKIQHNVVYDE